MKVNYLVFLSALLMAACSSMTVLEKESKRHALDKMAMTAIAGLIAMDATLQKQIDDSLGYAVANMKVTKVPLVGAGGGEGVLFNQQNNTQSYFTVSRFDVGGGWGARSYKVLMIINNSEVMDRIANGTWEFQAGVEASVGTAAAEGGSGSEGFSLHVLSDGGASATATARVIKVSVNNELMY